MSWWFCCCCSMINWWDRQLYMITFFNKSSLSSSIPDVSHLVAIRTNCNWSDFHYPRLVFHYLLSAFHCPHCHCQFFIVLDQFFLVLSHFFTSLCHFFVVFGKISTILDQFFIILSQFFAVLDHFFIDLGQFCSVLGQFYTVFGQFFIVLRHLSIVLGHCSTVLSLHCPRSVRCCLLCREEMLLSSMVLTND